MEDKVFSPEREIANHVGAIMDILGIPATASNENTPMRIGKMFANELFKNRNDQNIDLLNESMTLFPSEGNEEDSLITIRKIPFSSTCEHHWLPFFGTVDVSYIPSEQIVGLSKIPRVVKYFSLRPQLQERLTQDIAKYLLNLLKPRVIEVIVTATHSCVMCRGAESDCETVTRVKFEV